MAILDPPHGKLKLLNTAWAKYETCELECE